MEVKVYKCHDCSREIIPNPAHIRYENHIKGTYDNQSRNWYCPECDGGNPVNTPWFLYYDEYLQQKSIEAWK